MKAVYLEKHGGHEVLKYGKLPEPKIGPKDVMVRVRACALNHLDIWVRQGLPNVTLPMPHIPGSDVAGIVEKTGSAVTRWKKGDKVLISPGRVPEGDPCYAKAQDSFSPKFQILGLQSHGGYAEKTVSREDLLISIDDRYSFEEWAALPLASLTAYHMLKTRANLEAGETVLVHAGASGIGIYAIQIAKFLGAKVFTTIGDAAKTKTVKSLGADEVILYKKKNFAEEVKRLTGSRGVDVIFEHIGPETWPGNFLSLARGGRMVTCGATSGPEGVVDIRYLYSKQISIIGSYMGSFSELLEVLALAKAGTIKPVIDKVFPLSQARKAHERMESRKNIGKIVLKV